MSYFDAKGSPRSQLYNGILVPVRTSFGLLKRTMYQRKVDGGYAERRKEYVG